MFDNLLDFHYRFIKIFSNFFRPSGHNDTVDAKLLGLPTDRSELLRVRSRLDMTTLSIRTADWAELVSINV